MSRKSMPIMGTKMIKEIPWELISPHEKQAQALNEFYEKHGEIGQ